MSLFLFVGESFGDIEVYTFEGEFIFFCIIVIINGWGNGNRFIFLFV